MFISELEFSCYNENFNKGSVSQVIQLFSIMNTSLIFLYFLASYWSAEFGGFKHLLLPISNFANYYNYQRYATL